MKKHKDAMNARTYTDKAPPVIEHEDMLEKISQILAEEAKNDSGVKRWRKSAERISQELIKSFSMSIDSRKSKKSMDKVAMAAA